MRNETERESKSVHLMDFSIFLNLEHFFKLTNLRQSLSFKKKKLLPVTAVKALRSSGVKFIPYKKIHPNQSTFISIFLLENNLFLTTINLIQM